AETRSLDLGSLGTLGAIRFNRLRNLEADTLAVSLKINRAPDEVEGWSEWQPAQLEDGGWFAPELRGRYVRLRLELPAGTAPEAQVDSGNLFFLPQNRRPRLEAFTIIAPNVAIVPRPEPSSSSSMTL